MAIVKHSKFGGFRYGEDGGGWAAPDEKRAAAAAPDFITDTVLCAHND